MQFDWMDEIAELFDDGDGGGSDTESIGAPSDVSFFSDGEEEEEEVATTMPTKGEIPMVQVQNPYLTSASNVDTTAESPSLVSASDVDCIVMDTTMVQGQNPSLVSASDSNCIVMDTATLQGQNPSPVSASNVDITAESPSLVSVSNVDCLLMDNSNTHCNRTDSICPNQPLRSNASTDDTMLQRPLNVVSSPCSTLQPSHDTNSESGPLGFTIIGDNIDKNFRPSYQRQDRQTKSLHYFHSYAAKNRVDVSSLSDAKPSAVLSVESFLPTQEDLDNLMRDFEILTSRYILLALCRT